MKKILYGTTAILAAGMISTSANAAEPISLSLGGYMNWYVGYADNDSNYLESLGANGEVNSVDVMGNGEVHFAGDTTLDNGIKVGVQIELEGGTDAASDTDGIDESYITVDTTYGRLIVGSNDNVAYQMHVAAKDVGRLGVQESELSQLILAPDAVSRLNSTSINTDSDATKITYVAPTYYGVTLGASWIPGTSAVDGEDTSIRQNDSAGNGFEEGYAFGAMYSDEFQGIGVNLSAGYANFNVGGEERRDEQSYGANFTYMGFTLGGAYRHVNDPQFDDLDPATGISGRGAVAPLTKGVPTSSFNVGTGNDDGYAWDLGVAYEAGPYGVSVAYMKSCVEGDQAVGVDGSAARAAHLNNGEDEVELWLVSGKYNLGAGVDTFASFGHMNYDDEIGNTAAVVRDNDGWALVAGLALTF